MSQELDAYLLNLARKCSQLRSGVYADPRPRLKGPLDSTNYRKLNWNLPIQLSQETRRTESSKRRHTKGITDSVMPESVEALISKYKSADRIVFTHNYDQFGQGLSYGLRDLVRRRKLVLQQDSIVANDPEHWVKAKARLMKHLSDHMELESDLRKNRKITPTLEISTCDYKERPKMSVQGLKSYAPKILLRKGASPMIERSNLSPNKVTRNRGQTMEDILHKSQKVLDSLHEISPGTPSSIFLKNQNKFLATSLLLQDLER